MDNPASILNEIVRNLSIDNVNISVNRINSIISQCRHAGVKFLADENYNDLLAAFTNKFFPDFDLEKMNRKIDNLVIENNYHEAAKLRDEISALNISINKQFRKKTYKTEDWFIQKSENEICCLPTQIAVVDKMISEIICDNN